RHYDEAQILLNSQPQICAIGADAGQRRDKTVKSCLNTATVAQAAGDTELATVATLTAVMNQDGEGMTDLQAYARKRLVSMGVVAPNEEEQRAMEEAAANQQPDATQQALMAQAQEFEASAALKIAQIGKTEADTALSKAKAVETLASATQKAAQTGQTVRETQMAGMEAANDTAQPRGGDPDLGRTEGPRIRMGRDLPADFAA
ncbi:portal protein, partial [Sphingobium jiangsuense]